GRVPGACEARERHERRKARGCGEPPPVDGPEERHEPELIARQEEAPDVRVPERARERAAEGLHALNSALLVEMDEHVGVVAAAEGVAAAEVRARLAPVEERAGEDGADGAVLVRRDRRGGRTRAGEMREHDGPRRRVDTAPGAVAERDVGPTREREDAADAHPGRTTISTSPCTTLSRYSSPPVASVAWRWNASCWRRSTAGASARGRSA